MQNRRPHDAPAESRIRRGNLDRRRADNVIRVADRSDATPAGTDSAAAESAAAETPAAVALGAASDTFDFVAAGGALAGAAADAAGVFDAVGSVTPWR